MINKNIFRNRCLGAILIGGLFLPSGMMSVAQAEEEPRRQSLDWSLDEEKGIIRLNTEDPSYALWRTKRDTSKDPKREPGPISLNRTLIGSPFVGIPTFLRRPVAINPEDLEAGNVDVAFIGVPFDFNAGRRGTHLGPQAMRTSEVLLTWRSDGQAMIDHTETMLDPLAVLTVVDYGDVPVEPFNLERSLGGAIPVIREAAKTGATLLIAGGSHSIPMATVRGIAEANPDEPIALIHFDAHQDVAPYGLGHAAHYGNFLRTLVDDGIVKGEHVIQVGMRGAVNSKDGLQWQRKVGITTFYMPEIRKKGFDAVAKQILAKLKKGPKKLYISLDLDFYDSSVAMGTTAPEPGGVMPVDLFPLLRAMAIQQDVVGMDIVEINPLLDNRSQSTMLLAVRSYYEMLAGMALKKQGIKDPWYVHPDLDSGL